MIKQRFRKTIWKGYKQCEECGGYGLGGAWFGKMHISFTCKNCEGEGFVK